MRKLLLALVLAVSASLAPSVLGFGDPPPPVWGCFIGPIQGGTDEPDAFGMYPSVTFGRECKGPIPPPASRALA